jgi:hypothetical protein
VASPVKSSSVAVLVTIAFSMIGVVGELFPEARQHSRVATANGWFFSASWWSSANHATTLNWPESSSWWGVAHLAHALHVAIYLPSALRVPVGNGTLRSQ